jgi:hypothetical protein
MVFSWAVAFRIISSDSNRAPLAAFSTWGIAKNHTEPFRGSREPDEPWECCVWPRMSESDANNGRVHYRHGAAKQSLPTGPVVCVAHYHKGDEGPPVSSPW